MFLSKYATLFEHRNIDHPRSWNDQQREASLFCKYSPEHNPRIFAKFTHHWARDKECSLITAEFPLQNFWSRFKITNLAHFFTNLGSLPIAIRFLQHNFFYLAPNKVFIESSIFVNDFTTCFLTSNMVQIWTCRAQQTRVPVRFNCLLKTFISLEEHDSIRNSN